MTIYYTRYGIAHVGTATAVHELPFGVRIVTGITPPAAAAGAKQFSGIARCRTDTYAAAGTIRSFSGLMLAKTTATCELHTQDVRLDGIARCVATATRCSLTVGTGEQVDFSAAGTGGEANNAGFSAALPTRAAGDFLLMVLGVRYGSAGTLGTSSSGWTAATMSFTNDVKAWWRIATNDANDNFTATYTGGSNGDTVVGRMYSYVNVHATDPFEDHGSGNDFDYTSVSGANGANREYVGGDVPNDVGIHSLQYGCLVTFAVLDDNNTATTPTLTNNAYSTYPNTTEETAQFPFTLTNWHASTLGNDASLIAWHSPHYDTNPEIASFAAWGNYAWTTAAGAITTVVFAGLRPATGASMGEVWLAGSAAAKTTATCDLLVQQSTTTLDGILTAKTTATCDLDRREGKFVAGLMGCTSTLFGFLTAPHTFDTPMRCRCVANATLSRGTRHMPAGLLACTTTTYTRLTVNYMRALLACKTTPTVHLTVNRKLVGSAACTTTVPNLALTVDRAYAGTAACLATATAKLTVPMRGTAACRSTASLTLTSGRAMAGFAPVRWTATLPLIVGRYFVGSVGAICSTAATLTAPRLFAAQARCRSTASVALNVDSRLAGMAACHASAWLDLGVTQFVPPYWITEITVTPDMVALDTPTLTIQIESPQQSADVEE